MPWTPPQNVLQLSATGTVEVQQDLLSMTLSTTRDAADAATVQTAAQDGARRRADRGAQERAAGPAGCAHRQFQPVAALHARRQDHRLAGHRRTGAGRAGLSRASRRRPAASPRSTVGNIGFGLSREQRAKVEAEAQTLAIENFKQKAGELAKGFGFGGYTLREVSVNANQGGPIRPRMMAMEAMVEDRPRDAAVPVEAGKTSVVVNVSGSVQLK